MRIIGVDPGTRRTGWGVVEQVGNRMRHVDCGTIALGSGPLAPRLVALDRALSEVVAAYAPTSAAVESLFFAKNAQSAAKLGHARGVVLLSLARAGLTVAEYAPAKVKRAVVGRGRAVKLQVAMVVSGILSLPEPPEEDAADALAVAITHASAASFTAALAASRR